ncbi:MAG: efflux transporter periplasmic adaptor subunit [Gammaproteobacteria bacterium RIFCSPHIGHO2_02_FULL_39_13]|nr:MAG: efflux transporter periplasmic adaptor subunit [Gammaproteobacteria bacterium RIFCSPHIGHO2_02_FULL_39_13]OGT49629.1 MAG: efflux transporter periplasmic adaptor subunit [Gammaproteobacteria bacterium RIFCSPHIGHO2_12_FULL_39_24]
MKKRKALGIIIVVGILVVAMIIFRIVQSYYLSHRVHHTVLTVETTTVSTSNSPITVTAQGFVEASHSVDVQSQVAGVIQHIGFNPGDTVQTGQLLFQLDPTTYQANLAKDKAQYKMMKKEFLRYKALLKKGYVSKEQFDQIKAQLIENLNTVKLDQAQLNYTRIVAPLSGKTGNVTVKEGDLVNASSNQALVTINQLSPVFIDFYLSQDDLSRLIKYKKENVLRVEIYGPDKQLLSQEGVVSFIDNTVSTNTGTILLKASTPNTSGKLFPGESVMVKLIFAVEKNVLVIPTRAVQVNQTGNYVYVIKNNRAVVTPVKILRQEKKLTFIKSGLMNGDQIAVIFPPNLTDNAVVKVEGSGEHDPS